MSHLQCLGNTPGCWSLLLPCCSLLACCWSGLVRWLLVAVQRAHQSLLYLQAIAPQLNDALYRSLGRGQCITSLDLFVAAGTGLGLPAKLSNATAALVVGAGQYSTVQQHSHLFYGSSQMPVDGADNARQIQQLQAHGHCKAPLHCLIQHFQLSIIAPEL